MELGGEVAILLGILITFLAAILATYHIAVIAIFRLPPAIDTMLTLVLAKLGMNGGVVCYTALGSGRLSVDRTFFKTRAAHACQVRG